MSVLFISDLHLDESRPDTIELALGLINYYANTFDGLYILGDFVDYWIGDDYCQPALQAVFAALAALSSRGTTVKLMHGNRDFLISSSFVSGYNIELLAEDMFCMDLYGVSSVLMHGDTLCTDDIDYQCFRAQVRKPGWQSEFLQQSIDERLSTVATLRQNSQESIANKSERVMDVNQYSVENAMRATKATRLIHGHTHKPMVHQFTLDNRTVTRFVTGEWQDSASVLVCTPDTCELVTWPGNR